VVVACAPVAYRARVSREVSLVDLSVVLVAVLGAVATLAFSFLAFFDGLDRQALAFACGGIYLSLWAGLRLTGGRSR
jgi:hypothetical protein